MSNEAKRLRRVQAHTVMPLIGPLLDEYEMLSQDARDNEEFTELFAQLDAIQDAMEQCNETE